MELTFGQYELVYNAFSFGLATFFAATIFFWLGLSQVSQQYKTAVIVTGLVTFIAGYHYFRIFESWGDAYTAVNGVVTATGVTFNVAYRYVDWLLTVPLLLIELILVMGLTRSETVKKATALGGAAALMIILGYPGEVSGGIDGTRSHESFLEGDRMTKEAIANYEAALKEAFPSGATGDVFYHWNEARKALASEAKAQPAQRKPLTDEQIILIVAECAASHQHTDIHFARAIERAHGIKELV